MSLMRDETFAIAWRSTALRSLQADFSAASELWREADWLGGPCCGCFVHRRFGGGGRRIHFEHRPAALAQGLALPLHAGGDALYVRNFGSAKPHGVARAHLLFLKRIGLRNRR